MKARMRNKAGILVSILLLVAGIAFASDLTVMGRVKTPNICDENGANCKTTVSIAPTGMIAPFYLASCPSGWLAADGTNGTPDLRGQFIRGLNDFGSVEGIRNDGKEDPDGAARTLGDYQGDQLKTHSHSISGGYGAYGTNRVTIADAYASRTAQSNNYGGIETRPKNVALIFCMKQ